MRLRVSLGPWIRHNHHIWRWYYSQAEDALIQITSDSKILLHEKVKSSRNKNLYTATGRPIQILSQHLLKASIQPAKQNTLWLFDTGHLVDDASVNTCNCFEDFIQLRCISSQWCFKNLEIPTAYQPLLNDMQAGQIWLVSDGSFHPTLRYGSAAWILEGKTTNLCITGNVITPGEPETQSAYRSELSRKLAAITVMNALTRFHNIHAIINLFCDCKSGLKKAFSLTPPSFNDSSFDIIKSIHQELQNTTIQCSGTYIKGHQDDTTPFHQLDRPSQLNIQADHLAKELLHNTTPPPHRAEVQSNSWTLCIHNTPVVQDMDKTLYDHVHGPKSKLYWMRKGRITEDNFQDVLWDRLGLALDRMPFSRRVFCSKHTSGICGVGKFQKIWKLCETDACPHCGQPEDALHVWQCRDQAVSKLWEHSLEKLRNHLLRLDTDQNIITGLIHYLTSWRSDILLHPITDNTINALLDLQESIGK